MPQWTKAEVEEAFRRFAAANPDPRTELQYINPFTLLVAVVLSAQATDAGVNKATPALFKLADTPEKMVKLGEPRVRSLIKTIGLYRTKAKNVIALSRQLIAEHGGKVPDDREALEALPGVGRKTANVVLNVAFGEPTIAVDTHIFRVGNRTGLARRQNPARRRDEADGSRAEALSAARPPLAHPARPLHLPRPPPAVRKMHHLGFMQMAGEDDFIRPRTKCGGGGGKGAHRELVRDHQNKFAVGERYPWLARPCEVFAVAEERAVEHVPRRLPSPMRPFSSLLGEPTAIGKSDVRPHRF